MAKNEQQLFKRKTILFVDEIHRFNKLQQVCVCYSANVFGAFYSRSHRKYNGTLNNQVRQTGNDVLDTSSS